MPMSSGTRWLAIVLGTVMLGCVPGVAVLASGCSEQTPYPASLNSLRPDERARAAIHAAETGDRDVIGILVDRLEDPDEGVRFYAILALEKLTGTRLGYDYRAGASQRWRVVQEWRRHLTELANAPASRPAGGSGG
jgi:hypothetical protein